MISLGIEYSTIPTSKLSILSLAGDLYIYPKVEYTKSS